MKNDAKSLLENMMKHLDSIDYIKSEEIPNIDLYMDQVTTFMEENLAPAKRHNEDKTLTKTMINNYTKNDLLPPPEKKKYSKEHMMTLIFIYYFKNIMSIHDIQAVLTPITERYFGNKNGHNMQDIYEGIFGMEKEESERLFKDLVKKNARAFEAFSDYPPEEQELLHTFTLVCSLAYDVYVKKRIIELVIDDWTSQDPI